MKTKGSLLCILLCGLFFSLSSQTIRNLKSIGNGEITVIEIGNGDLWVGTADSGVYHYTSSLAFLSGYTSLGYVNSISLTSFGGTSNAFIGSTTGLADVQSGALITASGSVLPQSTVSASVYNPNTNLLYIFTPGAGGDVLDSLMQYHSALSLPFSKITCSYQAACAGLIAGSLDSGVFYSGDYVHDTLLQTPAIVSDSVTAVYIANSCNARLIGTRHGFSFCPVGHPCQNYTSASTSGALPENYISSIAQDCSGNIWLGMPDSGAVVFNPPAQSFTRVNLPANESQVTALAVTADTCQGITFIGTASGDILAVDTSLAVVQVLNTSVKSVAANAMAVKVYPQPASDQVNFVFSNVLDNAAFSFTDLSGRAVGYYDIKNAGKLTLNISSIAAGLYIYRVTNNGQLLNTGKFEVIK